MLNNVIELNFNNLFDNEEQLFKEIDILLENNQFLNNYKNIPTTILQKHKLAILFAVENNLEHLYCKGLSIEIKSDLDLFYGVIKKNPTLIYLFGKDVLFEETSWDYYFNYCNDDNTFNLIFEKVCPNKYLKAEIKKQKISYYEYFLIRHEKNILLTTIENEYIILKNSNKKKI